MTPKRIVVRGVLVGDSTPKDIVVENGIVTTVRAAGRGKADIGGRTTLIGPTFFDIQVNGAFGIDLQSPTLTPEDVKRLGEGLAAWGVSHWVPTIITNAPKLIERTCRIIAEAMDDADVAASVPGIHLEGPFISPKDGPRGAHPKRHVRKPDLRLFDRLLKAANGKILYTTLAPELDGAIPFIKAVVRRGVRVSLGHHDASADEIARAVDAGATLCTHLGNGLAPVMPRHANPLWPQLADDRLACSLIADMHHLPSDVLKTFVRAKGPDRIILISDAVHIAGLKPRRYQLAGVPVELKRTGRICLTGTGLLAGSSLMVFHGVLNVAHHTDLTLERAFACASSVPAERLRLRLPFRTIQRENPANFVVFSGEALLGAFVRGRLYTPLSRR